MYPIVVAYETYNTGGIKIFNYPLTYVSGAASTLNHGDSDAPSSEHPILHTIDDFLSIGVKIRLFLFYIASKSVNAAVSALVVYTTDMYG